MRIACLHTAESNIAVFETACRKLGAGPVSLRHAVRPDLLAAAERAGGLTPAIADQAAEALRGLCHGGVEAVLLTCSTLGSAVEMVASSAPVPVLRVDGALAKAAVARGGEVVALCAVETTLEPTRDLFERTARETGATVAVRLVQGAWPAFKAGQRDRYLALVAGAADQAFRDGAQTVALAQASMAGAADLCRFGAPLNSPAAGLLAAVETITRGTRWPFA